MKACLLRAPQPVNRRPLEFTDVAVPALGDDELLVRVPACGICRTDLHPVEGELPLKHAPSSPATRSSVVWPLRARARVRTHVEAFPLGSPNDALNALKNDAIRGAGVLVVAREG